MKAARSKPPKKRAREADVARDDYIMVVSLALSTDSIIYWLPTPSGIQPLLQPLTPEMWRQIDH